MHRSSSNLSIPCFRSRGLVWIMVAVFCFSFIPSVSRAQQPTATINTLNGTVLVNGQEQGKGFALSAGDVIETQAGADVVLEFSDGSQLELGENTKLDMTELSQTATGARVSRMKLAWGWIRAKLSPGHQKEGSSFDVETPNALVGVKFSQPIVTIRVYDGITEVIATVMVVITNLITGEIMQLSPGSTAIITEKGIEILSGTATGMSTTAKFGIGALALGAAGVVVVLAAGSGDGDGSDNVSFTGTFVESGGDWQKVFTLKQSRDSITGMLRRDDQLGDCVCYFETGVTGNVTDATTAYLSWGAAQEYCSCGGGPYSPSDYQEKGATDRRATLENNGSILYIEAWGEFYRQS